MDAESLREAVERWWSDHVEGSVSVNTAKAYATCLDGTCCRVSATS